MNYISYFSFEQANIGQEFLKINTKNFIYSRV